MNYKVLVGFIAALFMSAGAFAKSVDLSKSKVTWMGSKVIGSSHTGHIKIKSADIKYKDNQPASATVVIDMASITNTDLKDKKYNQKLVGHLKSEDFFNVSKFKTSTLKIDEIQKASDKFYFLTGKLTIMGVTKDVKLKAEVAKENANMQVVNVDFDFDRTDFGIKYGSGSFFKGLGDKMISDEVKMQVQLHIDKSKNLAAK